MAQTNLINESQAYRAKRDELRLAELRLMRQRERVAALRRRLPQGPALQDYVFEEGPANLDAGDEPVRHARLSELFTAPGRALVTYHLMFGKKQIRPCPMCTMLVDGLNGVARQIADNLDLVIVAAAPPAPLRSHARTRRWDRLRLLSCGSNTFKRDLHSEDREGRQDSTVSVLTKDPDGTVRHFYSARPSLAHDAPERGLDLLFPVYNLLDLIPKGRGNWYASLQSTA